MCSDQPVGFVGVGNMGVPMIRRLAGAGHRLLIHDLRPAAAVALADDVRAAGQTVDLADSLEAIGRACSQVITMLPDADAVRAVALGSADRPGLALAAGAVLIDMSSSAPLSTRDLGTALAARAVGLVDAPVSGGVPRARDGSLTIMAGGDPLLVERVEPLLSAMGRVQRTGALGSGHALKALNNYVSAAGLLAVCEALVVGRSFGLDPSVINTVLNAATGRNNTTDKKVEQYMLNRAFDSGFALALMRKDVAMARDLAGALGLSASWLGDCSALLEEAGGHLAHDADHTELYAFVEQRLAAGEG